MGSKVSLVKPKGLDLDIKNECSQNGTLRDVLDRQLQGNFDMNYCTDLGDMIARKADGLLAPLNAFAPGEITEICGVVTCANTMGTEDGSVDACHGAQCPDCQSYATCAVVELTLDTPAGLPAGTPIFAVADTETGNLSPTMGSIAGDIQVGAVERSTQKFEQNEDGTYSATAAACPTVYVRVGVDPKQGKA